MALRIVNKKNKYLILISVLFIINMYVLSYSKESPYTRIEFDKPDIVNENINKSSETIYDINPYKEYSPLNLIKVGINQEEYDSVNNYNIDFNTLDTRIKYFAPAYLNIKNGAVSSLWMAFYIRGGSLQNIYSLKELQREYLDTANNYKEKRDKVNVALRKAKEQTTPDLSYIANLTVQSITFDTYYKTYNKIYQSAIASVGKVQSKLKFRNSLYSIADVDNNHQVAFARNNVLKSIKSLLLSYLQLVKYNSILLDQMNLYKDIYFTYLNMYNNGAATDIELSTKLNEFEDAKLAYNTSNTTLKNLKEQLCINLGYSINDIDKINVIEPEVDLDYISKINLDEDKIKSYNSNSAYKNIKLSSKDKKLPGSTGEQIFHDNKDYTASLISVELENLYNCMCSNLILYNSNELLEQIIDHNYKSSLIKLQTNAISTNEYNGILLQNKSYEMQIIQNKFGLINAINDYYFAVNGILNIT